MGWGASKGRGKERPIHLFFPFTGAHRDLGQKWQLSTQTLICVFPIRNENAAVDGEHGHLYTFAGNYAVPLQRGHH